MSSENNSNHLSQNPPKNSSVHISIKKIHPDAIIPTYAKPGDAGVDLCSVIAATIPPGKRLLVPTGLQIALPIGYEAQVRPRSGLALKYGISLCNTPGTIDAGYRGEIGIIMINHGEDQFIIEKGMRIAQMVIARVEHASFLSVENLDETERGSGGFGHTGTR